MNEEHLAKVNWNSKSKEKIQLSKRREQACFWRQNSNYHRKWREQACFSMFSRWRQISNSNRMRNICRNGARSEADLAQCGALALPPPFFFCGCWCKFFFNAPFLNHAATPRKAFNGVQKGQVHSKKHEPSKNTLFNYFSWAILKAEKKKNCVFMGNEKCLWTP